MLNTYTLHFKIVSTLLIIVFSFSVHNPNTLCCLFMNIEPKKIKEHRKVSETIYTTPKEKFKILNMDIIKPA